MGQRYQHYARRVFEEIQILLKDRPKARILVQILVFAQEEGNLFAGLSGLLKTAELENPHFTGQLIEVAPGTDIIGIIKENALQTDQRISYLEGGEKYLAGKKLLLPGGCIPWKENGVYLITGGVGGWASFWRTKLRPPYEILPHPSRPFTA